MEGSGGCGEAECSVTDDDGSESKHFLQKGQQLREQKRPEIVKDK